MTPPVQLRSASPADAYALWLWANDPETRAASHGRDPIPWTAHVTWLGRQMESGNACVWIGEIEGSQPVGSIRFDSNDGWCSARLSYAVAPECRGGGFGRALVATGVARLITGRPGVRIWADVHSKNERSVRIFVGLGWRREEPEPDLLRFWSPEARSA